MYVCNVWANARENICKHSTNEKVCENTAERRQEEKRSGAFDYNTEVLKEFRGKTLVNGAVDARHPANDAARLHHCIDKTASFLFCHLIFKLEHKMRFIPSGLLHSNWLNAYIEMCIIEVIVYNKEWTPVYCTQQKYNVLYVFYI